MKIKEYIIILCALLIIGCSSESSDDARIDMPDTDNGSDGGNDVSSTTPSEDISTLWIGNITMAGLNESLAIMRSREVTFHGNSNYRQELNLPENAVIASVTGASFYQDGGNPTDAADMFVPWSSVDGNRLHDHPNVTVSFTFVTKEESNAFIIIDEPMTFINQSVTIQGDQAARTIEKGSFTIHANEDKLGDEIPPLWKENNTAFQSFKFEDVGDITDRNFNSIIYGPGDADLDVTFSDVRAMFQANDTIWISTREIAIVNGKGERLELGQPR